MNEPFFSIIIPVYQCEKTLNDCIESVLSQDESSYEMILTDDGSMDKSGEICDFYESMFPDRLKVIHKTNEGPLLARMDAIRIARGQYLMFLDSDDIYLPGILKQVRKAIEVCQADMVIFNHFRVFTDGRRELYKPQYSGNKVFEGPELTKLYMNIITGADLNALWQKCIYRGLLTDIEEFRKYERMMIGEDKLLSLAMISNAKRIIYLSDGLYEYHMMPQSISHHLSLQHYLDMSKVHLQTLKYMSRWELDSCRDLCCRNKVEFGVSCLYSVAAQIRLHQKNVSEFIALASCIIADQDYWEAFGFGRKTMAWHKLIVCWLLQRKWIRLALVYLLVGIIVKRGI